MTWQPMFGYVDKDGDLARPELYQSALVGSSRPTSLPPFAYQSKVFADLEDEKVWTRAWICVGYHARIPNAGDLLPFTVGNHGIHVQRQRDGSLKAHFNFAQHGGCRFVPTQCQTGKKTKCFYTSCGHSRDRDVVPAPADGTDAPEAYMYVGVNPLKLMPIQVETVGPFVFVNLDFEPELLERQLPGLREAIEDYSAIGITHVEREQVEVAANWKLTGKAFLDALPVTTHAARTPLEATDAGVFGFDAPPARLLWVYPNLLLALTPDHMLSIVLQPTGLTETMQYIDMFERGNASLDSSEFWKRQVEQSSVSARAMQIGLRDGAPEENSQVVAFQDFFVRRILKSHPYYVNKPLYAQPGRSLNAGVNARSF